MREVIELKNEVGFQLVVIDFVEVEDRNDGTPENFCMSNIQVVMQVTVGDNEAELTFQTTRIHDYEVSSKLALSEACVDLSNDECVEIEDVKEWVGGEDSDGWKILLAETTRIAQLAWDQCYSSISDSLKNNDPRLSDTASVDDYEL